MIIKRLEVGPFASNCYIVGFESTEEGLIIDPGDEAREILKSVEDLELDIVFPIRYSASCRMPLLGDS